MKKVISISFLLIFLFQLVGFYWVFKIQKRAIKNEMFSLINNHKIDCGVDVFEFDTSEFEKLKVDEYEFQFNEKMYDIINIEYKNSSVKVFCINDKKEETLFSDFHQLLITKKSTDSSKNSPATNLLKILTQSILLEKSETFFEFKNLKSQHGFEILKKYSATLLKFAIPPQLK